MTLPTSVFFAGRNVRRNQCRVLLHDNYTGLVGGDYSPSCGYAGLEVRQK